MKKACLCFVFGVIFFLVGQLTATGQDVFIQASEDAKAYFVHGIPGLDVGKVPALPLDIYIDDTLVVKNIQYGKVAGPIKVAPGKRNIAFYENEMGPTIMAMDPFIRKIITFKKMENASVVGHLSADGQATEITKFTNDTSPIVNNKCRAIVHHCMAAPEIYFSFYNNVPSKNYWPHVRSLAFENGDKFACELGKNYKWWMEMAYPQTPHHLILKAFQVKLKKAVLVYFVGKKSTGTIRMITKVTKKLK